MNEEESIERTGRQLYNVIVDIVDKRIKIAMKEYGVGIYWVAIVQSASSAPDTNVSVYLQNDTTTTLTFKNKTGTTLVANNKVYILSPTGELTNAIAFIKV